MRYTMSQSIFSCATRFGSSSSWSHWATVGAPTTHSSSCLLEMPRIDSYWPSLYSFNNYSDRHTQIKHTIFNASFYRETQISHKNQQLCSNSSSFAPKNIFGVRIIFFCHPRFPRAHSNETEYHKFFPETWMKLQINIQCGRATTSSHELMQWTKYWLFQCTLTTTATIDDEIGTGTERMQTDIFLLSHTISRQGISTYCPKPPFDYRKLSECVSKSH